MSVYERELRMIADSFLILEIKYLYASLQKILLEIIRDKKFRRKSKYAKEIQRKRYLTPPA